MVRPCYWTKVIRVLTADGERPDFILGDVVGHLDLAMVEERGEARPLAVEVRERLAELPGCTVLDRGAVLCATVTASFEGHVPADMVDELRTRGINTSSQTRIDAVIDYDQKGVDGALRMSPHYFNDASDLDALIEALGEIVR